MFLFLLFPSVCFAALVLTTLALNRKTPRAAWLAALGLVVLIMAVSMGLHQALQSTEEKNEIAVSREFATSVRARGLPISVKRAFHVSSHDVFHGDGADMVVYRYPSMESDGLVEALNIREPTFVWKEVPSQKYEFSSLRDLLPEVFLPKKNSWSLLVGEPPSGSASTKVFVIDLPRGTLYEVDNFY